MALANNGTMLFGTGVRRFGATAYLSAFPASLSGGESRTGSMRNLTAGQGITSELVGLPYGNRHPSAWMMPQKAGALASRNIITGAGALASAGTRGLNGQATLAGVGDLTGVGQLIISMAAALTGSGAISASAEAFLQLAASLAGAGDVDGALTAIAHAAAALEGEGNAQAVATALGTLGASITVTGDLLTTGNVGEAVWAFLIEAGYSAAEIVRIVAAQAAGAATGLEGANPQFTGLDGSTIRIDGTYAAGTRTIDALDGS